MMSHQLPGGAALAEAPFRAMQTDFPVGPSGSKRSSSGWSNMYVIPRGAKNPDLGWKWIELMLSAGQQAKLTEGFGFPMAPYREAYASLAVERAVRQLPAIANTPRILTDAAVWPYIRYTEVAAVAQPLLNRMVNGQLAPAAAMEEVVRLVNGILSRPVKVNG